ncbi:hypothetical protein GLOIN_2v1480811 [Rhizophagus clarus]|uniref:Uncharacterized protein n=1 Tax=Rhizophagus clarus TaxID=94130 RepID=A0A8H3LG97_9GLOM|nr:hypothetical protein GLOIN_2v1480811 [Rhizophagus clarus]
MIEEVETQEVRGYWQGMKKIASIEDHTPEGDIHFKEGPVGRDLERPHQNQSLMSKWEAIVPKRSNPAYAFNDMVEGAKKYKEIPYMPKKEKKDRSDNKAPSIIRIAEKWYREEMRALLSENYIDDHLTSSTYHQEHCLGLGEACQRVDLSVKEINDFEQFKNYGRMINSPCVIIADFEAGNKKPGLINGGKTRIISEQYANSFCYLVHWINTGDVWGPFLYRGNNTTQEFIRRIDQELIEINNVLVIKHERKVTEEDKKKFTKADTC